MPSAEIIAIGSELLLGETLDTNTSYIARLLRGLGVDLHCAQIVGDDAGRIAKAVRQALRRADIVITTGGLGPTVDDPTRQAVARAIGVKVEYHPELWKQVAARVARYGRAPSENQRRQAYLPQGAIAVENPVGTAPAFIVEQGQKSVICLPGVPREMETLLTGPVIPYLQKRFDLHEIIKIRKLYTAGVGESLVDEQIGDLEALANPTVGLTAHAAVIDIRIAAKAGTETEADRIIAAVEEDIRARLGVSVFGADNDTLEGVTLEAVAQRGWSLACIEVNLENVLLTRLAESSHPAYRGGEQAQVRGEALAEALESIRRKYNTSAALGVSLLVGEEKSEIDILLVTPHGAESRHLGYGGHPAYAPRWAANMALDWLRRTALQKE